MLRGGWAIFYIAPTNSGITSGFSQTTPLVATQDAGRTPFNTLSNPFPTGLIQPSGARPGLATFVGQGINFVEHRIAESLRAPILVRHPARTAGQDERRCVVRGLANAVALVSQLDQCALDGEHSRWATLFKGGDPNYLNAQVPNPFEGLLPGTTHQWTRPWFASQLVRPFPLFQGISAQRIATPARSGTTRCRSRCRSATRHGLTFSANYTFSKNIQATSYINAQDPEPTRVLTSFDRPHRLAFAPSIELPFGPGKPLPQLQQRRRAPAGWRMAVLANTVFQTGAPMGVPGNVWVLGDPKLENPTWDRLFKTGYIDATGSRAQRAAGRAAGVLGARPNTLQTTPARWGHIRNQWATTYDMSVIKNTRVQGRHQRPNSGSKPSTRLNTPVFSGDPNITPTSTNFGKVIRDNGQNNAPRSIQFGFRVMF